MGVKEVLMQQRRIRHNYHHLPPGKFRDLNRRVKESLTDNPNFPDSAWGEKIAHRNLYFSKVSDLEMACRVADNGDRVLIRDRDKLIQEMIVLLDELVPLVESMSVRNPDALFTTGFSVTMERRSNNRTPKQPVVLAASVDFTVANSGEQGKALATASTMPGAFNQEIHINKKDPSVEEYWFHKAIFPNPGSMVLENLEPGNTFFRMRHHGPEGPGPWSTVVSTLIS